jgi:Acetyltransferase (GNAT) domain
MIRRPVPVPQLDRFTSGALEVRLVTATATEIEPIWHTIETRVASGDISSSWAWTRTWLDNYGDLVPHRFAIGERDEPVAIALITEGIGQRVGPLPIRTVHIGTAGEPDSETVRVQYNRLLAAQSDTTDFLLGILALLNRSDRRWDEIRLDGFMPRDIDMISRSSQEIEFEREVCYVTELRSIHESGGSVISALGGDTAKKIRRNLRRLEETLGPVKVHWAESIEDARAIFAEMCVLHQARWESIGSPGVFASPRFAGFHRDIIERLFREGGIGLARVVAGDTTIGCDYTFREHNRLLAYQWGLAHLDDKRISVGMVVAAMVMQSALERGIDEYDHLAGDIFYKRQLSTTARELVWARAKRGARIQVIYKLAEAKRRALQLPPFRPRTTQIAG